jgi:hypothetical protein
MNGRTATKNSATLSRASRRMSVATTTETVRPRVIRARVTPRLT